ncbi:hypothetical protein J7I44_07175 [Frateuria sp. MAH-13]|uniref:Nucleotidyl transferase AbiEii toxin, Type IV TA system n=1 Tax=Frateuria flava TaxID=2821489 RepID=A0ABS4DM15_9GAMM|nr:hypothetical protein [Frateuria flava]MBP1474076.1 hypothetical protein [Frateuria flava]
MRRDDPNLPTLRTIAQALGDLREQVVFLGGAVAGLLVTDPLAEGVRATRDVDAVAQAGRAQFQRMQRELARRGFQEDADSSVICRWIHRDSGAVFDLMPESPDVLGFANRWYPYTVGTAQRVALGEGLQIRLATAVAFVATKLEAFASRGRGDVLASHDLEDVLNVVDGREELVREVAEAAQDVRQAIAAAFADLLARPGFTDVLPGLIAEPERADVVASRLQAMAQGQEQTGEGRA